MTKHMILSDGVAYVEAPAKNIAAKGVLGVCANCSLLPLNLCAQAIDGAAATSFGGDCQDRDVIYIKADPQPKATP